MAEDVGNPRVHALASYNRKDFAREMLFLIARLAKGMGLALLGRSTMEQNLNIRLPTHHASEWKEDGKACSD